MRTGVEVERTTLEDAMGWGLLPIELIDVTERWRALSRLTSPQAPLVTSDRSPAMCMWGEHEVM